MATCLLMTTGLFIYCTAKHIIQDTDNELKDVTVHSLRNNPCLMFVAF